MQCYQQKKKFLLVHMFVLLAWKVSGADFLEPRMEKVSAIQGEMVKKGFFLTNKYERISVTLTRNQRSSVLCHGTYNNPFGYWNGACNDRVKLKYDNEWIYFIIWNVSQSDSDVYSYTVKIIIPPPTVILEELKLNLTVLVPPVVHLSVELFLPSKNESALLCTARDFYPADIQLSWYKEGQLITDGRQNDSLLIDTNGSYSYLSYLFIPTQDSKELFNNIQFSCQVNHSTLKSPILKYLDLSGHGEGKHALGSLTSTMWIVLGVIGVFLPVMLIILAKLVKKRHKMTLQSSVGKPEGRAERLVTARTLPLVPQSRRNEEHSTIYSMIWDNYPVSALRLQDGHS
ncbi:uncharacterized protein LOC115471408 [Microcaecilia unicolor]|uniref:Uncharacterized protein LOC115471408 n=1 Tax=Microcaecilia unicolor TaxID=1415580 RepID=A0A6P7YDT8_9AMPH|nr:uncharacterized protein LOC115471408 [Microcaecilia unicolor]XP_030060974.1 uncharacterized protein LOC115471408 [Microcaecilia unicolor]